MKPIETYRNYRLGGMYLLPPLLERVDYSPKNYIEVIVILLLSIESNPLPKEPFVQNFNFQQTKFGYRYSYQSVNCSFYLYKFFCTSLETTISMVRIKNDSSSRYNRTATRVSVKSRI